MLTAKRCDRHGELDDQTDEINHKSHGALSFFKKAQFFRYLSIFFSPALALARALGDPVVLLVGRSAACKAREAGGRVTLRHVNHFFPLLLV